MNGFSYSDLNDRLEEACLQIEAGRYRELNEEEMDHYFEELIKLASSQDGES